MANVWLGDFRCDQLRYWQEVLDAEEKAEKASEKENAEKSADEVLENTAQNNDIFVTDDSADISWFESMAKAEVAAIASNNNIIFALGFNDCLGSCTWKSLDIKTIADSYIKILRELVEQNSSLKFYFCAVNPVDAACPGINYKGELISAETLNKKIEDFNKLIKEKCLDDGTAFYFKTDTEKDTEDKDKDKVNAVFIDSYDYFKNTSFSGRDGKYYSHETCLYMLDFVESHIRIASGISFTPRKEEPDRNNTYYYEDNYYHQTGYGMPNCTAYAYGRFFEILGEDPKFRGDAEQWFGNFSGDVTGNESYDKAVESGTAGDGFSRGKSPQLGAVICWANTASSGGHVAIVEDIVDSSNIWISESAWGGFKDGTNFKYTNISKDTNDNWNYGVNYKFQGFIYNPKIIGGGVSSGAVGDGISASQVIEECRYLTEDEMKINARYIWQYLGSRGWTLNAVAGLLGNIQSESAMTPALVEGLDGLAFPPAKFNEKELIAYFDAYKANNSYYPDGSGRYPGYGLTGWTFDKNGREPDSFKEHKFIEWCLERNLDYTKMDSALERILWEVENNVQWSRKNSSENLTFKEFTKSTLSAHRLAACFVATYERCVGWDTAEVQNFRGKRGEAWFEYLLPFSPFVLAPMSLVNLKIDEYEPTKITGSFVARNSETGSCMLFKGKDKSSTESITYTKKDLTGVDGKETEEKTASGDVTKILKFEFSNLTPNTEYRILVEIAKEDKSETVESEITFTTPQDYPDPVSNIKLQTVDNKFPNGRFKLTCDLNNYWGYWGKNDYGYVIQLLINGQCFAEKSLSTLYEEMTFTLSDYFGGYLGKLNDTIQIGIRTWVKDSGGKIIYDSDAYSNSTKLSKVSNSICMLTQPFIMYLNTD